MPARPAVSRLFIRLCFALLSGWLAAITARAAPSVSVLPFHNHYGWFLEYETGAMRDRVAGELWRTRECVVLARVAAGTLLEESAVAAIKGAPAPEWLAADHVVMGRVEKGDAGVLRVHAAVASYDEASGVYAPAWLEPQEYANWAEHVREGPERLAAAVARHLGLTPIPPRGPEPGDDAGGGGEWVVALAPEFVAVEDNLREDGTISEREHRLARSKGYRDALAHNLPRRQVELATLGAELALGRREGVRVVERRRMRDLLREGAFGAMRTADPLGAGAEAARMLGASALVRLAFVESGDVERGQAVLGAMIDPRTGAYLSATLSPPRTESEVGGEGERVVGTLLTEMRRPSVVASASPERRRAEAALYRENSRHSLRAVNESMTSTLHRLLLHETVVMLDPDDLARRREVAEDATREGFNWDVLTGVYRQEPYPWLRPQAEHTWAAYYPEHNALAYRIARLALEHPPAAARGAELHRRLAEHASTLGLPEETLARLAELSRLDPDRLREPRLLVARCRALAALGRYRELEDLVRREGDAIRRTRPLFPAAAWRLMGREDEEFAELRRYFEGWRSMDGAPGVRFLELLRARYVSPEERARVLGGLSAQARRSVRARLWFAERALAAGDRAGAEEETLGLPEAVAPEDRALRAEVDAFVARLGVPSSAERAAGWPSAAELRSANGRVVAYFTLGEVDPQVVREAVRQLAEFYGAGSRFLGAFPVPSEPPFVDIDGRRHQGAVLWEAARYLVRPPDNALLIVGLTGAPLRTPWLSRVNTYHHYREGGVIASYHWPWVASRGDREATARALAVLCAGAMREILRRTEAGVGDGDFAYPDPMAMEFFDAERLFGQRLKLSPVAARLYTKAGPEAVARLHARYALPGQAAPAGLARGLERMRAGRGEDAP
jgi:hypothetical protein